MSGPEPPRSLRSLRGLRLTLVPAGVAVYHFILVLSTNTRLTSVLERSLDQYPFYGVIEDMEQDSEDSEGDYVE